MLPVHEQAMGFREAVNIHSKAGRQPFGVLPFKINESRLFAAGAAALTMKVAHKRKRGQAFKACPRISKDYFPSCCSTKSPTTGSL